MITRTTTFGGVLLVLGGMFGFIAPGFMGMHLSAAHNLVFLVSGVAAIYFGLLTTHAAGRGFCIVFGALYLLLGLAGMVAEGMNSNVTIIPAVPALGLIDHVFHLVLGAVFLSIGLASETRHSQPLGPSIK